MSFTVGFPGPVKTSECSRRPLWSYTSTRPLNASAIQTRLSPSTFTPATLLRPSEPARRKTLASGCFNVPR
jgi:hypothetical protein